MRCCSHRWPSRHRRRHHCGNRQRWPACRTRWLRCRTRRSTHLTHPRPRRWRWHPLRRRPHLHRRGTRARRLRARTVGHAVVAGGGGIEAGRRGAVGNREGARTGRGRAHAVGQRGRTGGGRVIAIGGGVVGAVIGAVRLEVARGVLRRLGHRVQLIQVHRIGAFGTGGHVGDLALTAGAADGDGVLAIGNGVAAERHTVVSACRCEVADGRRVGAWCPGAATDRGREVARCFRRQEAEQGATDRDAVVTGREGAGTQRRAVTAAGIGTVADRRVEIARRIGEAADRDGCDAGGRAGVARSQRLRA